MRAETSAVPADAAKETDPAKRASLYGKAGLWFDYIAALHAARTADPKNESAASRWAKAIEKQGLKVEKDGTVVPPAK